MDRRLFAWLGLLASLLTVSTATAAESYEDRLRRTLATDAPGAADHALVGRYRGSAILAQTAKEFDELKLPAGAPDGKSYSNPKWGKLERGEGKVTRTIYVVPSERSTLEVQRNYQDALAAKGFEPLWTCALEEECGEAFARLKYHYTRPETFIVGAGYDKDRQTLGSAVLDSVKDIRYSLMRKTDSAGTTLVGIYTVVMSGGSNGDVSNLLKGTTQTMVEIVEPKPLVQNLVTIGASEIAAKVSAEGRIVFYGIQFDFDKAEIKPESAPQLGEMAKYLKASPQIRVYIVGHTDAKGGLDYNLGLSSRRAEAVAKALASQYGIDPKRLIARGLGPLAPIASNRTDAGQAKNRRVEMVDQIN